MLDRGGAVPASLVAGVYDMNPCIRAVLLAGLAAAAARAAEPPVQTLNRALYSVPPRGAVVVDARTDDWDLSGGIFVCAEPARRRDTAACWVHAMHDADHLYLAVRWLDDTPLNNPHPEPGPLAWKGDSLQFRVATKTGRAEMHVAHVTAFRDAGGGDRMDIVYGATFAGGTFFDPLEQGAEMAFLGTGGAGYVQEIKLPWSMLTADRKPPGPGTPVRATVQANFSLPGNDVLWCCDLLAADFTPDGAGVYLRPQTWGRLRFVDERPPRFPLELSDGTRRTIGLAGGVPFVDWGDDAPPPVALTLDPAERARLLAEVERLGSEDPVERRDAFRALAAADDRAILVLNAFRNDPDPEIRLSVRELIDGY